MDDTETGPSRYPCGELGSHHQGGPLLAGPSHATSHILGVTVEGCDRCCWNLGTGDLEVQTPNPDRRSGYSVPALQHPARPTALKPNPVRYLLHTGVLTQTTVSHLPISGPSCRGGCTMLQRIKENTWHLEGLIRVFPFFLLHFASSGVTETSWLSSPANERQTQRPMTLKWRAPPLLVPAWRRSMIPVVSQALR